VRTPARPASLSTWTQPAATPAAARRPAGPVRTAVRALQAAVAAVLMLAAAAVAAPAARAEGIVRCARNGITGVAMLDPIAARGGTSMHLHNFFGSTALLGLPDPSRATAAELGSASTTCTNSGDTASYWSPVLLSGGRPLGIRRMEAYYLCWNGDKTCGRGTTVRPFPVDLRLIAGNPLAVSKYATWSCGLMTTKPGTRYSFPSPTAADCATARPLRGLDSVYLTAAINFPSCWDGAMNDHTVDGNTADFSGEPAAVVDHLAYPDRRGCPAGFGIHLPKLRINIQWDYQGNGRDLVLPASLHADFLNSWQPAALARMVATCINTSMPSTRLHRPPYNSVCGAPNPHHR